MENEKKTNSSQNVLNVILVIICGAIMGLFVYDYINKNDQIAEYKADQKKQIEAFNEYVKKRGQEYLEEIDVWFSSRKDLNKPGQKRKDTGLYMVHYVEDAEEAGNLRDLLIERDVE